MAEIAIGARVRSACAPKAPCITCSSLVMGNFRGDALQPNFMAGVRYVHQSRPTRPTRPPTRTKRALTALTRPACRAGRAALVNAHAICRPGLPQEPPLRANGAMVHTTYDALYPGELNFEYALAAAREWSSTRHGLRESGHCLREARELSRVADASRRHARRANERLGLRQSRSRTPASACLACDDGHGT